MALFRPTHGELSGSIGNATFSHGKGGPIVRNRSIPTNPNKRTQAAQRAILSTLARSWAALADNQRAEWIDWARTHPLINALGEPRTGTGLNAYARTNTLLHFIGQSPLAAPPTASAPTPIVLNSVTATAVNQITIAFSPHPMPAGKYLVYWVNPPHSQGRSPAFRAARQIGEVTPTTTSPVVRGTLHTGQTGQALTVWIATTDLTGQLTVPQRFNLTIP